MLKIGLLTESDRNGWEGLTRRFHAHFAGRPGRPAMEVDDDGYEHTWHRLIDRGQVRGIYARLDGNMVGIAHYLFHTSVWGAGRCYLAELFVDPHARRRGIATAMIEWVARDAEEHGAPRLYWNTEVDAEARALYDKVGVYRGYILYNYSRPAKATSGSAPAATRRASEPSPP
ncbi:GNAT family N-acetyltransferase [Micromonospora inaquosa]|uniref:GNAT family N-acetyltransferase n=1 Tax=Micromonospora inaquosa TaxID=2203716 RepID=A0A3N9W5Y6_9ACTN|nr:GNAT family N-acetyltransferase [Micromonospora inaquosa]